MLTKLDEYNERIIKDAEGYIGKCERQTIGGAEYVDLEDLFSIIENLNEEVYKIQEKYDDLKNDLEENYKWAGNDYGV